MGWFLTLADALAGEYGWSPEQIDECPLAKAWALMAAAGARNGLVPKAETYEDRELCRRLKPSPTD